MRHTNARSSHPSPAASPPREGARSTDPPVAVHGLRVDYGHRTAVDGISFEVGAGQVLALLGPNGAGKTTTVRVLATLRRPTGGRALVAGHDVLHAPRAVRAAISVTGQETSVDGKLTGRENLRLMARLLGMPRRAAHAAADEALDRFALTDAADRQVGTYSGGMRRRLDLAVSLLRRPVVLFLDEPTTGLDPRSRQQVWDVVAEVARAGTAVLLTTQYLEEADQLADRIAVIDHGRLVADGTAAELKRTVGQAHLEITARDGTVQRLATDGTVADARRLLDPLPDDARWRLHEPTLDDVFLTLTGRPAPTSPDQPAPTEEAA